MIMIVSNWRIRRLQVIVTDYRHFVIFHIILLIFTLRELKVFDEVSDGDSFGDYSRLVSSLKHQFSKG